MDLVKLVFDAGVVGCGGAGFPTHVKYNSKVDTFIVNGAECEPLLRTDRYLMLRQVEPLLEAVEAVGGHLGAKRMVIALKETYKKEIESLEKAIKKKKSPVELFLMQNYYPAGDEQMIVCEVTGKVVPPSGIPLDVGAVVSNVATLLCVRDALEGKPVTHRYLTVTGEVPHPVVVKVPIGTPVLECIALAGREMTGEDVVISGGPLMGAVLDLQEAEVTFVTKTTSGLILLTQNAYLAVQREISIPHMVNRARSSCIQCSFCTEMCPRYLTGHPLQPHRIMRKLAYNGSLEGILGNEDVKQALICCECGICTEYACPMQLQPSRVNTLLKAEYAKAGIRYQKPEELCTPRSDRQNRKVPSKRIAARIGVLEYYDYQIEELVEYEPKRVTIPLSQHIGAPAQPCVAFGDMVVRGQLIGKCPEGKLGANIHAGIGGRVAAITKGCVTIEGQEG